MRALRKYCGRALWQHRGIWPFACTAPVRLWRRASTSATTMPKASVDITTASREEIEALLAEFGLGGQLDSYQKCYGGFSGSNYACVSSPWGSAGH